MLKRRRTDNTNALASTSEATSTLANDTTLSAASHTQQTQQGQDTIATPTTTPQGQSQTAQTITADGAHTAEQRSLAGD